MSVKRYDLNWDGRFSIIAMPEGGYVSYMDYVTLNTRFAELQAEKDYLSEYTDHLVSFSKLPCLPKDLENLREANIKLVEESEHYRKKYLYAQNKLDGIDFILNN